MIFFSSVVLTGDAAMAGAAAQTVSPAAVAISAPFANATVSGTVAVSVMPTGLASVMRVQLKLDGSNLGAALSAPPVVFNWDTTTVSDGPHILTAGATDVAGNLSTSAGVGVTVRNGILWLTPQDTTLNIDKKVYAGTNTLSVYTWPDRQVANAILMKFDLSAIPASSVVQQATLRLSLISSDAKPDTTYRITANKIVGKKPAIASATGYNASSTTPWTATACCFSGIPMAQADISAAYDAQLVAKTPGDKTWTLTTMVQEWVANPAANLGVLLNADASTMRDRYRIFASSEHADAKLRPYLYVKYNAAAPGDVTPPSIAMSAPADGSPVKGTVMVSANATDNVAVAGVQFKLDGANWGNELTAAPYTVSWNSESVADGPHTWTAVARDAAGNATTAATVAVTASNGIIWLAPQDTSLNIDAVNYSTSELVSTYTWPDNQIANAILMKFNLSSLPTNVQIDQASLVLALVQADATSDSTYTMTAHKIIGRNPVISAATGFSADGTMGWTPNACCYNGVPLAQGDISPAYDAQAVDKTLGYKVWNVTTMVREWRADPSSNLGVLLNGDPSKLKDRYRYFGSSRNPATNVRPVLIVKCSTPTGDTTPPSVAIIAPAGGTTVKGMVSLSATASDNVGVAGVQFRVDGVNVDAEDPTAPYGATWDTTTAANGSHTITAAARDAAGNIGTSPSIVVTVSNDQTPPVLSAIKATSGSASTATITWTTNEASDSQADYGTTTAYGGSASSSSLVTAHSLSMTNLKGSTLYHFRVGSRDAAGNLATSGDFTFTTGDATPPTISITAPAGGSTVSGSVTITANAADDLAVAGVQFKVDGTNLGAEDTTAPYSASWSTTAATNASHTLTAVARDAAGNTTVSSPVMVTVSNSSPTPPPPGGGIASRYPGDVGIETDPNVVFVERFDESSTTALFSRWTDILNGAGMQFSTDVPAGSPLSRSLNIPWVGGGVNNGGHLYKVLSPGIDDTLYIRYYIKYPTAGQYHHTGIWMGGYNPALSWPSPQAGTKPTGSDRFSAAAEQNSSTARFDHYDYWSGMHLSADGSYWGNVLLNNPSVKVATGSWACVEQMVKLNTAGSLDGEHAIWLNGVKVSHLGPGFPNGTWSGGVFTQSASGTPFPGFAWRTDSALKINYIWLQNYSPDDPAGFAADMKFAHVVAARSYIGCLAPAGGGTADTTPPSVSIASPTSGAMVSGIAAVTANASDNVGVAGVQFKVDGASVASEDTSSPFVLSWNSAGVANGSHTLTAVARDAAGNTMASAPITVNVNNNPIVTAWPNEPTAMTLRTDWSMDQAIPTSGDVLIPGSPGWRVVSQAAPGSTRGWAALVFDSSAPFSPSGVYDFVYPAGMVEGNAPATVYYSGLGAREVYAGFWWKASSPFDYGPNGNKIAFIFNGGGGAGGQQFMILMPDGKLHVLPEYPGDYRWRTPNVNATVVTLGVWHRVEWYTNVSTGVNKWWLDGVLQGSYTDVRNSYNFDMFQFSPTWGGNVGARKRETDHYWFDHVRISTR